MRIGEFKTCYCKMKKRDKYELGNNNNFSKHYTFVLSKGQTYVVHIPGLQLR